ncbi:putative apolipoprotein E [Kosakonia phage Kc263]|uniref:Apolipoprotein E n=1 Tax=Kosakonia phage Kc263 TaxID=2863194 RepID=A0AAE7WFA2_9CAUD|nr:putative apolipoprotein E [Kosakonia phage Kc263]QYN79997.1 putative apolipoprotein E [Kosakonia phage Kc263]
MSFGEVEHFATMVSGCESINQGDVNSLDAKYAFSVLKLHANDMGIYAGNESFLDSVKKGAQSVKEWCLKLLKAIVEFVTGSKRKIKESKAGETANSVNISDVSALADLYKKSADQLKAKLKIFENLHDSDLVSELSNAPRIAFDFDNYVKTMEKFIEQAEGNFSNNSATTYLNELGGLKMLDQVNKQADNIKSAFTSGAVDEKLAVYATKVLTAVSEVVSIAHKTILAADRIVVTAVRGK